MLLQSIQDETFHFGDNTKKTVLRIIKLSSDLTNCVILDKVFFNPGATDVWAR